MMRDVKNWVELCDHCNAAKTPTKPYKSPLLPQPVRRIGEVWSAYILGPLPKCHSGAKYMLVFMELMSKWAEVFPLVDTKAHIIPNSEVERFNYFLVKPLQGFVDVSSKDCD